MKKIKYIICGLTIVTQAQAFGSKSPAPLDCMKELKEFGKALEAYRETAQTVAVHLHGGANMTQYFGQWMNERGGKVIPASAGDHLIEAGTSMKKSANESDENLDQAYLAIQSKHRALMICSGVVQAPTVRWESNSSVIRQVQNEYGPELQTIPGTGGYGIGSITFSASGGQYEGLVISLSVSSEAVQKQIEKLYPNHWFHGVYLATHIEGPIHAN